MIYWKLINRHELEALAAKASSKQELVDSIYKCDAGPRGWMPFVILRDLVSTGDAIPILKSADWALNETIDRMVQSAASSNTIPDEIKEVLKETLQKGLAAHARAFGRYHAAMLFNNSNGILSKRIHAGSDETEELNEAEAEMVTRLLAKLELAMQKHSCSDREVFAAFLRGGMLNYIPDDTPEYNSYMGELSASKRMHAELQILQMLLGTHLQSRQSVSEATTRAS